MLSRNNDIAIFLLPLRLEINLVVALEILFSQIEFFLMMMQRGKGSDSDNPRTLNTQADENNSSDMPSKDIAFSDAVETPTSTNTCREKNDLLVVDPLEHMTAPNLSPKSRKVYLLPSPTLPKEYMIN